MVRVDVRSGESRSEVQARVGRTVFVRGPYGYASGGGPVENGTQYDFTCSDDRDLHLRDLRDALAGHLSAIGLDAFFSFGSVLNVLGFPDLAVLEGICIQQRLRIRMEERTGILETATFLVGRADTRWVVEGSLADANVRRHAQGERAARLAGSGPPRGEIREIRDTEVVIGTADGESVQRLEDYTIGAGVGYVRTHHGPATLRRLQTASGSLAANGLRNRYAVKDRFTALGAVVAALGWSFPVGSTGNASIAQEWTEIRIQEPTGAA